MAGATSGHAPNRGSLPMWAATAAAVACFGQLPAAGPSGGSKLGPSRWPAHFSECRWLHRRTPTLPACACWSAAAAAGSRPRTPVMPTATSAVLCCALQHAGRAGAAERRGRHVGALPAARLCSRSQQAVHLGRCAAAVRAAGTLLYLPCRGAVAFSLLAGAHPQPASWCRLEIHSALTPLLFGSLSKFGSIAASPRWLARRPAAAGCTAILDNLFYALCDEGDGVLIPAPYYPAFDNDLQARLLPCLACCHRSLRCICRHSPAHTWQRFHWAAGCLR